MQLSACYIVGTEAEDLAHSIASLADAYDELIVVQTADSPAVREVIRHYRARTAMSPWQEDFSIPRNAALGLVRGDWVLFLDADESFRSSVGLRMAIEDAVRRAPAAEGFLLPRINTEPESGSEIARDMSLRLFRHLDDIVYQGSVHENACHSDGSLLRLAEAGDALTLIHTGYSRAAARCKKDRNLRLMRRAIERDGPIPAYDGPMAQSYFGEEKYREAARYARRALESDIREVVPDSGIYHVWIESLRQLGAPLNEQLAAAQRAVQELPAFPELWGELGMILCGLGRLPEADRAFQRALALYADPRNVSHRSGYMTTAIADQLKEKKDVVERILKGDGTMKQPLRIFAGYIVPEENEDLRHSIRSVQAAVDHILVCHTAEKQVGALERTVGAEVFFRPWDGDFAAARNAVLQRAAGRCDWLIFLDADESFTEASQAHLRAVIERADVRAEGLLIPLVNIDADHGGKTQDKMLAMRVIRMAPGIHYVGRIHESLRHADGTTLVAERIHEKDLQILHTGYSDKRRAAKGQRNLAMLEQEMRETKHPELLYHYFADTYFAMDRLEEAEHYARLDVGLGRQPRTFASKSYRILLQILGKQPERRAEYGSIVRYAVRDFPELPEFRAEYATVLAQEKRWKEAADEMEQALSLLGKPQEGTEISLFPPELLETAKKELARWREKIRPASPEHCLAALAQAEGRLIMALLAMGDPDYRADQTKEELPERTRRILDAQHGIGALSGQDADGYLSVLEVVLLADCPALWARYAEMAAALPREVRLPAAAHFEARGAVREARRLYDSLLVEGGQDAGVTLHRGICAYRLGDRAAARRDFDRLGQDGVQLDEKERHILESYRIWCRSKGEERS